MSLPAPAPGQERQNRKLLEQLEEQKKRLRQATQTTTPAVPAKESTQQSVVPMPSPASVMQSSSTDTQHMNAAQRAALQTAVVFRRMYPPKPFDISRTGPFRPKLKRSSYVYVLEENTNQKPAGDMEVILVTDVDGLGFKGDVVTVSKRIARNHMLPVGVAEYVTPDSLAKYERIRKENENRPRQSISGHETLKELEGLQLPVPMSATVPWVINKSHLRVAFRASGIELTEDCITLPEQPIDKPGNYIIDVAVNKLNTARVKIIVYHYNKSTTPTLPPLWSDSPAHKFNILEVLAAAAKQLRLSST